MLGRVDDFAALDATAQAELVRRKDVTPRELVEAAIARIEAVNPELNAVVTPMFDQALGSGRRRAIPTRRSPACRSS